MTTTNESIGTDGSFLDDPEWKALGWGVGGALALLVGGLLVGLIEGNLLPGDCQGLACLFTGLIVAYAGAVVGIWIVAGIAVALARKRWPTSNRRLWAVRVLAVLSWAPFLGLIVIALD
jgi:hypothetical protein